MITFQNISLPSLRQRRYSLRHFLMMDGDSRCMSSLRLWPSPVRFFKVMITYCLTHITRKKEHYLSWSVCVCVFIMCVCVCVVCVCVCVCVCVYYVCVCVTLLHTIRVYGA